jgi:beta-galactosidase
MSKLEYRYFGPMNSKIPHIIHGGDYNPEQWRDTPEIWDEDMRLMRLAGCNAMSIGIFSWAALEPKEGEFDFSWLDAIMDKLAANEMHAVLATPSGARPAWLSKKYPEVLRVQSNRTKNLHGQRHNHCFTSPIYREKTRIINAKLAERYKDHPALLLWHVSNEYGGDCHCPLCQEAFRSWLKVKYHNDLKELNRAWWADFWGHRFTDWSQIESPAPQGEVLIHAMNLDWNRFVTDQTVDFYKNEIVPLRELTPRVPITVNMMGTYPGLNYWKFAHEVDVISWDNYPAWGCDYLKTWELAANTGFVHDINRCIKGGKPFLMMESTPSLVNWQRVNKLKPAGLHELSSLQALAHGSDSVQYFQWRKSRGCSEKFHGAVVDHEGSENTRVFREVEKTGKILSKLDEIVGCGTANEVALIYDWENRWAIDDLKGLREYGRDYEPTAQAHYRAFWNMGVGVDVINMDQPLTAYKVIVAPMLYMLKPGVAERLADFVKAGGTLVTTYLTGYVDENDLCFQGGFPGGKESPLRQVIGLWAEEIDSLYDADKNTLCVGTLAKGMGQKFHFSQKSYQIKEFCELVNLEGAEAVAQYGLDWYKDRPVLTRHNAGKGISYHIAARTEGDFLRDFYLGVCAEAGIEGAFGTAHLLPEGVSAHVRGKGVQRYIFLQNFSEEDKAVPLGEGKYVDLVSAVQHEGNIKVPRYGTVVLREVIEA